jgi:SAM-dependent methyltransferase
MTTRECVNFKETIRLCPICKCSYGKLLTYIDFLKFSDDVLPDHYDVVSCASCGFVYNDTIATQSVFDLYYTSQAKYDGLNISGAGQMSDLDNERYNKFIRILAPFISTVDSEIADIGCGQGGFLKMLKSRGFHRLFGLDPSAVCVKLVVKDGINAMEGNLLNFQPHQKFDVVVLTGVLEHIFDLRAAAVKLFSILMNSGLLLIEVPDASRYLGYDCAPFYRFDFEHINHFSIPHLRNLFGLYRFELVVQETTDNKVSQNSLSPTIMALFRKSKHYFFEPEFSLEGFIGDYIHQSQLLEYNETIEQLARSGRSLLVWGLGAHTARLLKQTRLNQCNIVAFIDNSPHKTGKSLLNKPVYSSQRLPDFTPPAPLLLISSVLYAKEMQAFAIKINYGGEVLCLT